MMMNQDEEQKHHYEKLHNIIIIIEVKGHLRGHRSSNIQYSLRKLLVSTQQDNEREIYGTIKSD